MSSRVLEPEVNAIFHVIQKVALYTLFGVS